jgi:hypothetical protein
MLGVRGASDHEPAMLRTVVSRVASDWLGVGSCQLGQACQYRGAGTLKPQQNLLADDVETPSSPGQLLQRQRN